MNHKNDNLLRDRLRLISNEAPDLLHQGLRGIERETLRVTSQGELARTQHPRALGSALTHPQITTDYAETLLEFITPAQPDIATALEQLGASHRFSAAILQSQDEYFWSNSMPCVLPDEKDIAIGWYGTSHLGMLKHVYRRGLALRYGKTMQCIAGIHYNFSLSEDLWRLLQKIEGKAGSSQDFQSESYIALIRNFRRYSWLLMVLFGASPAVSTNFLRDQPHQLQQFSADTLYLPYATSLRMSDLGYQSPAQAGLTPHYNNLAAYLQSLSNAVSQPYPPYAEIGTRRKSSDDGAEDEWQQLNTNILQIENEYYSPIRPKRVIQRCERPIHALATRGVQYIEVRCMDIDPFEACGISLETARFLDAFLHFCAFDASPLTSDQEGKENTENFKHAVREGRRPGLMLQRDGKSISLQDWGLELLDRINTVAQVLDAGRTDQAHTHTLAAQRQKLSNPELTPSARVLASLRRYDNSFTNFALHQSKTHTANFRLHPLSATKMANFATMAQYSLEEQEEMERSKNGDFAQFVEKYNKLPL